MANLGSEDSEIYDVLIVGAGPCGLAVAARLSEDTPSALFTDSEHQRYHWMKKAASQSSKAQKVSRRSKTASDRLVTGATNPQTKRLNMKVLDASSDTWMHSWDTKFKDLGISHLRSPMFFHPDPRDRDGLLGFVYKEGREKELVEIGNVVGKGLSKYQRKMKVKNSGRRKQEINYLDERDRNDYFRPSQALFKNFCQDITTRYGIEDIVEKSEVNHISYEKSVSATSAGIFSIHTSTGVKRARIIVLATGAALKPSLPSDCPFCGLEKEGSVTHAFAKSGKHRLPEHLLNRIKKRQITNVVVIGGGLTSAQIVDTAVKAGVTKVWHLMRGPLKVKHFDVDLPWVGKYKNYHLATFWSADDDEERAEMIRTARNGGSITPEYHKILTSHISSGRAALYTNTTITKACWSPESQTWTLETSREMEIELPHIDHVIYATGLSPDFKMNPCLKELHEKEQIECVGGLPCLTDDLMWNDDMPFFVTGRMAGLRLGPGSGNLEGARAGAERIAWKIGDMLREEQAERGDDAVESVDSRRLGLGINNQFSIFAEPELE
ncbi:hypothetical protein BP6252_07719 [Coleophoma cylindrospora]|uniref:L-ornithine N(5)-monooxygenase [NAD(P)H] n=1 Tax=Coleophoma cylindrospora TaxID=1849047 RepID=A0A3D8RB02_9HELO|nr:hypothetical protein BP6252_07719 [Coleophoma cylindrospora]